VDKYTFTVDTTHELRDLDTDSINLKRVSIEREFSTNEFDDYLKEKMIQNHWLYCRETKIRLLPKFYYVLAKTFIETPGEYERRLDLMCYYIGRKSDDGDKYVDKYSGYTIRVIDFVKEYGDSEDIEEDMETIVEFIDRVLMNFNDESIIAQVAEEVNEMMGERAMFVF
jgi:hypothetical protein